MFPLNKGVTETESCGRKFVQNVRIQIFVVIVTETALKWQQSKFLHFGSTNDYRKPFVVSDVLHLSNENASSHLVETLVFPRRIQISQLSYKFVVLSYKNGVSDSQIGGLIWTRITFEKIANLFKSHQRLFCNKYSTCFEAFDFNW